jgi:hypothetical protein
MTILSFYVRHVMTWLNLATTRTWTLSGGSVSRCELVIEIV